MENPKTVIENSYQPGHFVVVTDNVNLLYPSTLWDGINYHGEAAIEDAREKSAYQVSRMSILGDNLGFGIFQRRGMAAYQYVVYAIIEGVDHTWSNGDERRFSRAMKIGNAHDAEGVERLVRDFHAKYAGKSEDDLAEELDRELGRHDWYAAMSDAPGIWRVGMRHMDEVIKPLLAHLPEKRGLAVWKKHAPEAYAPNPYTL